MRILDVGCGRNKAQGAIGIDVNPQSDADLFVDLTRFPYPFRENSFDVIVCKQILEHLPDLDRTFEEFYRILKPKGCVRAESPHFSCFYAHGDPTHKRSFSFMTPEHFTKSGKFKILNRRMTFHKAFRWWGFHLLANRFPTNYERFWTFVCPAEHLYFELEVNGKKADSEETQR